MIKDDKIRVYLTKETHQRLTQLKALFKQVRLIYSYDEIIKYLLDKFDKKEGF